MTEQEQEDADSLSNQADDLDTQAQGLRDQADALQDANRNEKDLDVAKQRNEAAEQLRKQANELSDSANKIRENLKVWRDAVADVKEGEADPAFVQAMSGGANIWGNTLRGNLKDDPMAMPNGDVISKPDGVNVAENSRLASRLTKDQLEFLVRYGGFWDYKQHGDPQYQAFGNFHYGVTSASLYPAAQVIGVVGIQRRYALRYAGLKQIEKGHSGDGGYPGNMNNPFGGKAPYGDEAMDQNHIQQGFDWYDIHMR